LRLTDAVDAPKKKVGADAVGADAEADAKPDAGPPDENKEPALAAPTRKGAAEAELALALPDMADAPSDPACSSSALTSALSFVGCPADARGSSGCKPPPRARTCGPPLGRVRVVFVRRPVPPRIRPRTCTVASLVTPNAPRHANSSSSVCGPQRKRALRSLMYLSLTHRSLIEPMVSLGLWRHEYEIGLKCLNEY